MTTALIIGHGQIGAEIAAQLSEAGIETRIATRSAKAALVDASPVETATVEGPPAPLHVRADATDRDQLRRAAEGADVIFACAHAAYDSRVWEQILPALDAAVLDTAAELGIPVVFPESVYGFAGLEGPVTESSPFAPSEDKGRIRQRLIVARRSHPARAASVIAGDLIGTTAEPNSSVVRLCITERVKNQQLPFAPARTNVPHGITVIADLAAAMIRTGELLHNDAEGTHRLVIAPTSNPTLDEIAAFTASEVGTKPRKILALPHWVTRASGLFDRSMYELAALRDLWYRPNIVEPGEIAEELGTTPWQQGVRQML